MSVWKEGTVVSRLPVKQWTTSDVVKWITSIQSNLNPNTSGIRSRVSLVDAFARLVALFEGIKVSIMPLVREGNETHRGHPVHTEHQITGTHFTQYKFLDFLEEHVPNHQVRVIFHRELAKIQAKQRSLFRQQQSNQPNTSPEGDDDGDMAINSETSSSEDEEGDQAENADSLIEPTLLSEDKESLVSPLTINVKEYKEKEEEDPSNFQERDDPSIGIAFDTSVPISLSHVNDMDTDDDLQLDDRDPAYGDNENEDTSSDSNPSDIFLFAPALDFLDGERLSNTDFLNNFERDDINSLYITSDPLPSPSSVLEANTLSTQTFPPPKLTNPVNPLSHEVKEPTVSDRNFVGLATSTTKAMDIAVEQVAKLQSNEINIPSHIKHSSSRLLSDSIYFGDRKRLSKEPVGNFALYAKPIVRNIKHALIQGWMKRMLSHSTIELADENDLLKDPSATVIWRPFPGSRTVRLFYVRHGRLSDRIDNSGSFLPQSLDKLVTRASLPNVAPDTKQPIIIKHDGYIPIVRGGYKCTRNEPAPEQSEDDSLPPYGQSDIEDYGSDSEWDEDLEEHLRVQEQDVAKPGYNNRLVGNAGVVAGKDQIGGSSNAEDDLGEDDIPADYRGGKRRRNCATSDKGDRKSANLSAEEVASIVDMQKVLFRQKWIDTQKPKLEAKSYYIYQKKKKYLPDMRMELVDLQERRLIRQLETFEFIFLASPAHVCQLCGVFEQTIYSICELEYFIALCEGPEPLKPQAPLKSRTSTRIIRPSDPNDESQEHWDDFFASEDDEIIPDEFYELTGIVPDAGIVEASEDIPNADSTVHDNDDVMETLYPCYDTCSAASPVNSDFGDDNRDLLMDITLNLDEEPVESYLDLIDQFEEEAFGKPAFKSPVKEPINIHDNESVREDISYTTPETEKESLKISLSKKEQYLQEKPAETELYVCFNESLDSYFKKLSYHAFERVMYRTRDFATMHAFTQSQNLDFNIQLGVEFVIFCRFVVNSSQGHPHHNADSIQFYTKDLLSRFYDWRMNEVGGTKTSQPASRLGQQPLLGLEKEGRPSAKRLREASPTPDVDERKRLHVHCNQLTYAERLELYSIQASLNPSTPFPRFLRQSNTLYGSKYASIDGDVDSEDSDDVVLIDDHRTHGKNGIVGRKNIRSIWPTDAKTEALQQNRFKQRDALLARAVQQSKFASNNSQIIINLGHDYSEEHIFIPDFLGRFVKDHQVKGIQFLWKNIIMLRQEMPDGALSFNGCILAHAMGLGKTFQVICFLYTLLVEISRENPVIPDHLIDGRIMIAMPPTLIANWENEFQKWIPPDLLPYLGNIIKLDTEVKSADRAALLSTWACGKGILLIGYEMIRQLYNEYEFEELPAKADGMDDSEYEEILKECGIRNEYRATMKSYLLTKASLVICDEGHVIKNPSSIKSIIMNAMSTPSRICLTGYPLQNNLSEYFTMIDFVYPGFMGTLADFKNHYENPIINGSFSDSTVHDKWACKRQLFVLNSLIEEVVLRLDTAPLVRDLPPKSEYVIVCRLTPLQMDLYKLTLAFPTEYFTTTKNIVSYSHPFIRLCNHPAIFKGSFSNFKYASNSLQRVNGSERSVDNQTIELKEEDSDTDEESEIIDVPAVAQQEASAVNSSSAVAERSNLHGALEKVFGALDDYENIVYSNKMMIVLNIIELSLRVKDKILVFSQSIPTIDFLKKLLKARGIKTLEIKGSVLTHKRNSLIREFNSAAGNSSVFLISTRSGSVGVNLVSANRIIIVDCGWNPLHEEQAIARAYRYGQTKHVYIYRLQTGDTFETQLYKQNVQKVSLSKHVVDKKSTARNFTKDEMKKYFEVPRDLEKVIPDDAVLQSDPILTTLYERNTHGIIAIEPHEDMLREVEEHMTDEQLAESHRLLNEERLKRKSNSGGAVGTDTTGVAVGESPLSAQNLTITTNPERSSESQLSFDESPLESKETVENSEPLNDITLEIEDPDFDSTEISPMLEQKVIPAEPATPHNGHEPRTPLDPSTTVFVLSSEDEGEEEDKANGAIDLSMY